VQEHYKIPRAPASEMYTRPRCACLACSDLSQPAPSELDGDLCRQPVTRTTRRDDNEEVYYNSNEVDMDQLHHGCRCFGGGLARSTAVSVNAAGRQGRPLLRGNTLSTCIRRSIRLLRRLTMGTLFLPTSFQHLLCSLAENV